MKKYIKIIVMLLVISIILPGIVQASPTSKATPSLKRIAGPGRVETSVEISKIAFENGGATNVVLAGYNGEVDALTGTLLANAKKAPLLLTKPKAISDPVKKELKRLGAKNIYILGGEAVVSKAVFEELKKDYTVKRIAGSNREGTAAAVAKEVGGKTNHIFLAKGYNIMADALAAGPVSAIKNMPILLTRTDRIDDATLKTIKDLGVTHITIVGGESAVSKAVESKLKAYSLNRVKGDNREKTAVAIAEKYFTNPKSVIIANGYVYADALVGGYLGAKDKMPILLTRANGLDINTKKYLDKNIDFAYVLGGKTVVNEKTFTTIKQILSGEYVEPPKPVYNTKIETRGLVFDIGKSSDQIKLLKDFFRARKATNVTGGYNYDSRTKQLVKDYQKLKGLQVDGFAGKLTLAEMNKEIKDKNYKVGLYIPYTNIKGDMIIINKSSNTLYLMKNGIIQNSYPVATGKTESLTPHGKFKIVVKYKNPSWGGAGISPPIAGGAPNNPLGTRWLGISHGGGGKYGVHGNAAPKSIGTYASLGCVRMFNQDVEKLYEKVKIGTPIWLGSEKQLKSYGVNFKYSYGLENAQAKINITSEEKDLNVRRSLTSEDNMTYDSFYEIYKLINGDTVSDEDIKNDLEVLGGYDVEFLPNDDL